MNKFKALQSVTNIRSYSELIADLFRESKDVDSIERFLSEEMTEGQVESLWEAARRGFPITVRRIDFLQGLLSAGNVDAYLEFVFDMATEEGSLEKFKELLLRDLTEFELQTIKSAAQNGYPVSLEGMQ